MVDTGEYLMLPGGLLERGETFEQAAIRETREETGLEVEIQERINEISHNGVEVSFTAKVTGGELKGSWEGNPHWISIEELGDHHWRYNRDVKALVDKAGK